MLANGDVFTELPPNACHFDRPTGAEKPLHLAMFVFPRNLKEYTVIRSLTWQHYLFSLDCHYSASLKGMQGTIGTIQYHPYRIGQYSQYAL